MDATAGDGGSEPVLVIGPVDIDVALVGIDVAPGIHARFEAAQAEDARHDQIPGVFPFVEFVVVFANIYAAFEHSSRRSAGANSVGDLVQSARRAQRVLDVGRRPARS